MPSTSKFILFNSLSIVKMQSLARDLSHRLCPGDVITLSGEVGSGKTTFARAMIESIAPYVQEVTSPTFTLMQSYDVTLANGGQDTLWHLDLYRLKHPEEAEELGLRELWRHITLIEWPEIIEKSLPGQRLDISFDFGKNHDTRSLRFGGDEAWQNRIKDME